MNTEEDTTMETEETPRNSAQDRGDDEIDLTAGDDTTTTTTTEGMSDTLASIRAGLPGTSANPATVGDSGPRFPTFGPHHTPTTPIHTPFPPREPPSSDSVIVLGTPSSTDGWENPPAGDSHF